tara:strand:- start:3269 stop:4105 length:837 start_codon:yes stop_codon:yes gene_type:complete
MIRNLINTKKEQSDTGFRYRGDGNTRIENLTDAVFAFSITLLVISSEVPKTYIELETSMYGFVGFIACTMMLFGIWNSHNEFFLRYGLTDKLTKSLNFLFLFLLLFYIYPLKYLFSFIGTLIYLKIKMALGDQSEALMIKMEELSLSNMNTEQWADLMVRFGIAIFCIYLIFSLFYINALRKKEELKLDKLEIYETKTFMHCYFFVMTISVISMAVVLLFGGYQSDTAGLVYISIAIFIPIYKKERTKRYIRKQKEAEEKAEKELIEAQTKKDKKPTP